MASTDASDLNRVAKTKRQHTATCERCRGQKLRYIRTPQGCERCQKTGAICIVDPNVRMGRPKRGDTGKERRERPEKTTSPRESRSISQSALSATVEWASETNDNMWFRYDPDETRDLAQGPDLFDLDLHNAALGDDHVHSTSASASDDWFDAGGFDQAFPQAPSTNATSYSAEPSPFISIDPPTLTTGGEKRNSQGVSGANTPSTALQGLIERMTSLNLDLHQQSIIAGQIVGDYGNIEPGLMEPPHKDNRLSFAVDSTTQGLQTFHGLLLEIIGTASRGGFSSESANRAATMSQQVNRPPRQQHTTSRFITPPSRSCVPSLFSFGGAGTSAQQTRTNVPGVDLPTSLMIISCHIHLIRLCRHIFAGIRAALSSRGHHQRALLVLSSCQIGGVSISQDSDLNLLILIQVVARLINKIGVLLGYPCSSGSTAAGESGSGVEEENKALLPQLLRFVLAQEGVAGQPSYGEGMEALREEIRKLNEGIGCFIEDIFHVYRRRYISYMKNIDAVPDYHYSRSCICPITARISQRSLCSTTPHARQNATTTPT